jgi:minor extracellular protease Epr
MRPVPALPFAPSLALLLALLSAISAAGAAGIAMGAAFHNDREPRIHDDHAGRDAARDQRDTERREQDARDRELKDTQHLADSQAKVSTDTAAKDSGSSSGTSGSSGSGSTSGTSGSSSTSSSSGTSGSSGSSSTSGTSGSSGSGSTSGTSGSSGSGSTSGTSGSSGSGSTSGTSGSSGSGSTSGTSGSSGSGSGSDDEDDADDDDNAGGDENAVASGNNSRIDVETDPEGRERRKGELLVRGDIALADALHAAGFTRLSVRHLSNLDQSVIRVRVREGSTLDADLAYLQHFQGATDAEPNYVFRLSGGASTAPTVTTATPAPTTVDTSIRVGVIDTGADSTAPGLGKHIGSSRAFGGHYTPRAHGTHVAQILIRQGVRVDVADVFQTDANGEPLATAESIARGIDWMASRGVPVINVSISGPRSALLSEVVSRAIARGSIIIAAAGNDGPSAPPVYPAAFPEVVGVTAVDANGRIYRRANRGDYVDFAAFGVRVPVDAGDGRIEYVSGTSYAAPLVAAAVARRYRAPHPGDAPAEVTVLRGRAVDMGDRGRDPVFGWGLVPPPAR